MKPVTVRAPATTANLGPGYDAFGLALAMHNTFAAEPAPDWRVEVTGEGASVLSGGFDNQVARAMARVFAEAGQGDRAAHVHCENQVPTGRGLGSSAAAIAGGLVLADAMLEHPLGLERLFCLACEIEGHPDNVAAALYGGFAIGWHDQAGWHAVSIDPGCGLAAVAAISAWELPTTEARRMLPDSVPHADATFGVGRAGLLAAGIATGRPELIGPGLADRLHQPYRAAAVPDFDVVADAMLEAGALGAVLSGAGPTIVGLVAAEDDNAAYERAIELAAAVSGLLDERTERYVEALAIDRRGAAVL
jgi:homoserine kinase